MRYFLFFLFSIAGIHSLTSQVTKHPLLSYSTADDIRIVEIANVQKDHLGRHVTLVKMEYAPRQDERFMIPPGMYINATDNVQKRYELIGFTENSHHIGKWYPGNKGETYLFTIIFEGIEECINTINIYEPEIPNTVTWVWKEIILNNYCNGKTISPMAQNFAPIDINPTNHSTEQIPSKHLEKTKKESKVIGW